MSLDRPAGRKIKQPKFPFKSLLFKPATPSPSISSLREALPAGIKAGKQNNEHQLVSAKRIPTK